MMTGPATAAALRTAAWAAAPGPKLMPPVAGLLKLVWAYGSSAALLTCSEPNGRLGDCSYLYYASMTDMYRAIVTTGLPNASLGPGPFFGRGCASNA